MARLLSLALGGVIAQLLALLSVMWTADPGPAVAVVTTTTAACDCGERADRMVAGVDSVPTAGATAAATPAAASATAPASDTCAALPDVLAKLAAFGVDRGALARSVVHAGSGIALRRIAARAAAGEAIHVVTVGGSISGGAGMEYRDKSPRYCDTFFHWFAKTAFPQAPHSHQNIARSATGSNYWRFCYHHHVPAVADLIILDVTINDVPYDVWAMPEHARNQEALVRRLLSLPTKPALLLVGFPHMTYRTGQESLHSIAVRYDLPLVSFREVYQSWLFTGAYSAAQLESKFYGIKYGHPRESGHDLQGLLMIHYFLTSVLDCDKSAAYVAALEAALPPAVRLDEHSLGATIDEPRGRRAKAQAEAVHPDCHAVGTRKQPQPLAGTGVGWTVEDIKSKMYWRTQTLGSVATFGFQTSSPDMTVYIGGLKADYLNGTRAECWIDNAVAANVTVDTKADWWSVPVMTEIGVVPQPGNHNLSCVMVEGIDFRLTGIFADREVL